MLKPIFIISFDCEGKWGAADHISGHQRRILTNERLNIAYQQLVDLLDKWNIKGTFAFVGAFTMSVEEYQAHQEWFIDAPINGKNWLAQFRKDSAANNFDGWFNPIPFETVRKSSCHEIASHGFCHIPLSEDLITETTFRQEMELVQKAARLKNQAVKTLVYPRNLISYTSALKAFGIIGYRSASYSSVSKWTYAKVLLSDLNIKQTAQTPTRPDNGLVNIPSGYFLNRGVHLWKSIPVPIILRRWFHAISDAIAHNRVIHLYTHPHNFIEGQHRFVVLEQILKFVSERQKRQEIISLTQAEYCTQMLNLN
jgi:hypothetical protein